jgi:hypothetical protein
LSLKPCGIFVDRSLPSILPPPGTSMRYQQPTFNLAPS